MSTETEEDDEGFPSPSPPPSSSSFRPPSFSFLRCSPMTWSIVSIATLVFPAPVGAHISRFPDPNSAASHTRDWIRFSDFMPAKAGRAHDGSASTGTSRSPEAKAGGAGAGT